MSNVVGLDPQKERIYIPKCDRKLPSKEQVKFKVRMLTLEESAEVKDGIYHVTGLGKERKEELRTGTLEMNVLKTCFKGWENFFDNDKKEVPFNLTNIGYIAGSIRTEISDFCRGEEVEEETAKN